jgi:hypothetical protein
LAWRVSRENRIAVDAMSSSRSYKPKWTSFLTEAFVALKRIVWPISSLADGS